MCALEKETEETRKRKGEREKNRETESERKREKVRGCERDGAGERTSE